jgi:osmoprotectant transport system substrate-binding protein
VDARGWIRRAAPVLALLVALGACDSGTAPTPPTGPPAAVVVASFNFAESELLAEIYAQALRAAGVPVRLELDLGPRELVAPALREGLVDIVPDYLGTELESLAPNAAVDRTDPHSVLAALRRALAPLHLLALRPSTAADQNGFAVTRATAARLHLRTLSDLAAVRPPLVLGGPSECPTRPYCLAGLRRVYGLRVRRFVAIDDETQRATALAQGVIDVAVTFTTDGLLATGRSVLLRDDRRLQPTERVVPIVSAAAVRRFGTRRDGTLDMVSAALDSAALRFLNWRVSVAGKTPAEEARGWLHRHRLPGG